MSRKNAFLFTLLLTSTNIHTTNWLHFKPVTIAQCELITSVALMTSGIRCMEEILYQHKKDHDKKWSDTFNDPVVKTEMVLAALFCLAGGWTFNDLCKRLNISY